MDEFIKFFKTPVKFLETYGINSVAILVVIALVVMWQTIQLLNLESNTIVRMIVLTGPIWLPYITFLLFYEFWLYYVRKEFDLVYDRITLEIKLPQDIFKSPEAMELILLQMHQASSPDNLKETYIDGKHPPTTSLELVSRGGEVHFYVNVPKKRYKDLWEAQFYAHYPGVEIHALDIDYTAEVPYDPTRFMYFMFHMSLKKPDAYPIKTYIDYGMDKLPKEEEKIDPINSVLEMLASINAKEHIWIQILITADREYTFKEGSLRKTPDWKAGVADEIKSVIDKAAKRAGAEEGKGNVMMLLTDVEKDKIKAMERTLGKAAFKSIIRAVYICPADAVRIGDIVPRILSSFRVYDDLNRNAFGLKWRTDFDYPWWQDPKGKRRAMYRKVELEEYKKRILFLKGEGYDRCVLTTEELATIFHLPGKVATTPSLYRIPSKRAEPPPNLPV